MACDIFSLNGKEYLGTLILGVLRSRQARAKRCETDPKKLKRNFASHEIPLDLLADKGIPYNSDEVANFAHEYEFELRKSSPTYPQSNGRAENAVKTAKQLLKEGKRLLPVTFGLVKHANGRSRLVSGTGNLRQTDQTSLPTNANLLQPKTNNKMRDKIIRKKKKQKNYRGTKNLHPLKTGDIVRVHLLPADKQGRWFKARTERKADIRSYIIRKEGGQEFKRNRKHQRVAKKHSNTHWGRPGARQTRRAG